MPDRYIVQRATAPDFGNFTDWYVFDLERHPGRQFVCQAGLADARAIANALNAQAEQKSVAA